MNLLRPFSLAMLLTVAACAGGDEQTTDQKPTVEKAAKATKTSAVAPPLKDKMPNLTNDDNIALVPSPVETEKALRKAGIDKKLSDLISNRELDLKNQNLDNAAVRTGVVIADMLLTVKTADKPTLESHLNKIRVGMKQLGGGDDIDVTIQDLQERVKADAVNRDKLLHELDELSGAVIPELKFNGQERIVPLIQAGSWLEGANLVAKAVKNEPTTEAADILLKQPAVVDYFIKYVRTTGKEKAPAPITAKLDASLSTLKVLAEKKEPFTPEDIDAVIAVTDDVLNLL